MAEFHKVFNMQGFDVHRATCWQMVPVSGERYLALRGGAGLTVNSSNSRIVTVTEVTPTALPSGIREPVQATDRLLKLTGVAKGSAMIRAIGTRGVELEVDVKAKKEVHITFNFVRDSAGHHTRRVSAQAADWVRTMNYIYKGQANVHLFSKLVRSVSVSRNLGGAITTTLRGTGEEAHFYPLGDSTADINMFLVWSMDITDSTGDEDAYSDGTRIVFEDTAGRQVGETMSHEVGHVLGLADQYTTRRELMYGYTDTRGIHLPKEHVNIINP